MDISIVQIGEILFFFIMIGYHFYLTDRDKLAGFFWGIIISIKFFPALLFFYVYKQKRIPVFRMMLLTSISGFLLPLFVYGSTVYINYFTMVSHILWYGDSWNASLYGYLFRLLINTRAQVYHELMPIETLFGLLFVISLIVYYLALGPKEKEKEPINHQPFCLTIVMMLFLSPFGWLYYFPMLILPIALTFFTAFDEKKVSIYILFYWVFSFFLVNFPQTYVISRRMHNYYDRTGIFSIYFLWFTTVYFIFDILAKNNR